MTLAEKIFESMGFRFECDFTEDIFDRVMSREVVRMDGGVFMRNKDGGILITAWNAYIGIHGNDAAKGYSHVMELYKAGDSNEI